MNKNKFYTKLTSGIFYFSILLFIIAFNFSDNGGGGWTQQFLPSNLPGITDITFTDSLTGYAVTARGEGSYIIKTTNGGDNWNINFQDNQSREFTKVVFINNNTGFACTKWGSGSSKLYKTTNSGDNWFILNNPTSGFSYLDLSVLNENELWTADDIAFDGGVFKTTNGGLNWQRKYYDISRPADRVYMYNSRIGFIANGVLPNGFLRKTSDGGNSWILLNDYGFYKMHFEDSLIGYKSDGNLKSTIDGGINWDTILAVQSGNPPHVIQEFVLQNETIWGVDPSGNIITPNIEYRGVIYKTTNLGNSWSYQLPDTSINLRSYRYIDFSDTNFGWAYSYNGGVHTTIGGDTVSYPLTSINSSNLFIPKQFQLFQNYPNPFNPKTKIEYEIQKSNNVLIKVFDIQGREVKTLINKRQSSGSYKVEFDGNGLPSGVYFYSLILDGKRVDTRKMIFAK